MGREEGGGGRVGGGAEGVVWGELTSPHLLNKA